MKSMLVNILNILVILFGVGKVTFACNGYKLTQHSLKSCNKNSIIQIKNVTWTLDEKCLLRAKGCATVLKPFTTAKGHFRGVKFPLPEVSRDIDYCTVHQTYEFAKLLPTIGVTCPQTKKTICSNGKKVFADVSRFKDNLGMLVGKIETHQTIQHDSGSSCFDYVFEIKRA